MGRKQLEQKRDYRHRCGQCALAKFLADNLTLNGEVFLLKCPHYKGGEVYHFAKDYACEHFINRKKTRLTDE